MKSKELFEKIEDKIGYKPTQTEIANLLGKTQSVIGARVTRNSNFSDEDIKKIEIHYAIQLNTNYDTSFIELKYYTDIEASCGTGLMPQNEAVEKITIAKDMIANYSVSDNYFIIRAVSDSMLPKIQPKDLLIIKQCEEIIDNHIYIFNYKGKIYCKYLSDNLGQIVVKSSNVDYPTRYIESDSLKDFRVIGEVIGQVREY